MSQLATILIIAAYVCFVLGTNNLADVVNCGEQAVLFCTSTQCNSGYTFLRDNNVVYNSISQQNGTGPDRYSATVTSDNEVELTITNIQLSDAGNYTCSCGFNTIKHTRTLRYECKAKASAAVTTLTKKLSITVDSLFPSPSSMTTTHTIPASQISGTYTCETTPHFHYKCTWVSTTSLPDGNRSYTITVNTGTHTASVSGSYIIVTPESPTISNVVTISNNRQTLRGVQDDPLTIHCLSKGGIPAPTLAWYRNNTSTLPLIQSGTASYVQQSDGTYTVNLTYGFTPSRTNDTTTFVCRLFYPGATTGSSPDPSPAMAQLYLDLKPSNPNVSQTGEAQTGGNMTIQCSSTDGRPAPNITWSYKGQAFIPKITSRYDPTSETYTVVSVLQRPVKANDNGQTASCTLSHTTLPRSLTGAVSVDVKFGPSTKSTTIVGKRTTPATGANWIQLNCTSGSSYPASNITWYNESLVLPNIGGYIRWPGDNNGVITSNIFTITPTRYMDGDRITCISDNGYGSDSTYVDLDIQYSPLIQSLLNITASEGKPNVTLTCSASSKPPAVFTWYKSTTKLTSGTGTLTDNSFSYVIPRVDRTDAGNYMCHAANNVGSSEPKDAYLIVNYPPKVTVSTTNSSPYTVTCKAEGYPDSYTYQDWVQIWPGYGPVATIPFTGTTLTLTNVTYERSGVYVCGASNGVVVYGTDVNFTNGNATFVLNAIPVLIDPSPDGTRVLVAGRIGQDAATHITYWSNVDGSVVICSKHVGGVRSNLFNCSGTETNIQVTLPVNSHMVPVAGTLVSIKIPITSEENFTDYDIILTNREGASVLIISIVPHGPPEASRLLGNFSITPGQVILTVLPGFHGGYNQTLVVQISTDLTTWFNKTSVNIGQNRSLTEVHLVNLPGNTMHYVRVFAFNTNGSRDEFSAVLNFTTVEDNTGLSGESQATLTPGIAAGVSVPLIIVVVVLIIWWYRKVGENRSKARTRNSDNGNAGSGTVVECALYESAGHVQRGSTVCDLYSTANKQDEDIAALYTLPIKPKKGEPPKSQGGESVYEYPEASPSFCPSKPKKKRNKDGLIYADLEFNYSPKKSVIHGKDDVTTYVQVDFTKATDPLPDSDEEANPEK